MGIGSTITFKDSVTLIFLLKVSRNNIEVKMRKLISAILILCLCLGIYSCSKNDEDDLKESTTTDSDTTTTDNSTTDTTAPTVTLVSTTANNQSSVSITDNITVTFSEAMDNTTVTTNTDNTSCYGTLGVSSDNFSSCVQMSSSSPTSSNDNQTFTLDPSDNLTGGTNYLTRVTTGVKDTAGNALSSQYDNSTGFTTSSSSSSGGIFSGIRAKSVCYKDTSGKVKCWGRSNLGQLGYGDTTMRGDGSNEMGDNLATVDL